MLCDTCWCCVSSVNRIVEVSVSCRLWCVLMLVPVGILYFGWHIVCFGVQVHRVHVLSIVGREYWDPSFLEKLVSFRFWKRSCCRLGCGVLVVEEEFVKKLFVKNEVVVFRWSARSFFDGERGLFLVESSWSLISDVDFRFTVSYDMSNSILIVYSSSRSMFTQVVYLV